MEFVPRDNAEDAFIHYGLGNLFFDQQFFGGRRFFMDELYIYEGRLLTIDLFTGIIEEQGQPRPMTPEERENFLFMLLTQYGGR
jgi:poly-gamma-glutamate synthesis protein (capsule biosynthesis protein)